MYCIIMFLIPLTTPLYCFFLQFPQFLLHLLHLKSLLKKLHMNCWCRWSAMCVSVSGWWSASGCPCVHACECERLCVRVSLTQLKPEIKERLDLGLIQSQMNSKHAERSGDNRVCVSLCVCVCVCVCARACMCVSCFSVQWDKFALHSF